MTTTLVNKPTRSLNRRILSNVVWFTASVILAFWVWYIATTAADPVEQTRFRNIAVQMEVGEGLLVTNSPTSVAQVTVTAQQSVLSLLTDDDIIVRADMRQLGPGTHTVPLIANVNRRNALADTQPTQITVTLEQIAAQQKAIGIKITHLPPIDFTYEEPTLDIRQAEVRGAASQVTRVSTLVGEIDLTEQRNPVQLSVRLVAVDTDGTRVEAVTVEPQSINVGVNIYQRDDVRQISISPRILVSTLPSGYLLSTISYEPKVVFVGGSPAQLSSIKDTFFTEPIDLSNHTSDFEITVPIELPENNLIILDSLNTVTVRLSIVAQISVKQIDDVSVEVISGNVDQTYTIVPDTVSVVLNGPSAILETIRPEDIQIVLDLSGLAPGNHVSVPRVSIKQGQTQVDSITLLPPSIDVIINLPAPPTEVTAIPTP